MLLQTLGHFKGLFYQNSDIIIDDLVFKLHYGVTTLALLFLMVLVSGKAYLGDPIQCSLYSYDFSKTIQVEMLNSYCYIHSTFIIPGLKGETYPGLAPYQPKHRGSAIVQSYYQWVPLVLLLQALSFLLPHFMWKQFENGLVKSLRMDLVDPSLDDKTRDKQVGTLVDYFEGHSGRNRLYGKRYLYCISFNFINILGQIFLTDKFLGGIFWSYGFRFSFGNPGTDQMYPFEDLAFPKMSRCHLHLFGPSGSRQLLDAICVLPLNILHDKAYLVLWFWYFFLVLATGVNLLYWLVHYQWKSYRLTHIQRHLKGETLGNRLKPFNKNFGDWFLLHQVYKNIEHRHFCRLVSELCKARRESLRRVDTNIKMFDEEPPSDEEKGEMDPDLKLSKDSLKVVFH